MYCIHSVWMAGFEPAFSSIRTRQITKLSHTQMETASRFCLLSYAGMVTHGRN